MESDKFDCDAEGCAGRARWLVWLEDQPDKKFFACDHDVDAMHKAVAFMNTKLKMGPVIVRKIDDVLITDPRTNRGAKTQA